MGAESKWAVGVSTSVCLSMWSCNKVPACPVSPCLGPVTAGTGCVHTCNPIKQRGGTEDQWIFFSRSHDKLRLLLCQIQKEVHATFQGTVLISFFLSLKALEHKAPFNSLSSL